MLSNEIKRVLADRKQMAEAALERRRTEVIEVNPDFPELEDKLQQTGIRLVMSKMEDEPAQRTAQADFDAATEAYERAVKRAGFLPEEMELTPLCDRCGDTGYSADGLLCQCMQAPLADIVPEELDFTPPTEATFRNNNLKLFTTEKNPEWYRGQASPYQGAMALYKHADNYVKTFSADSPNLYFYGKPGTGKTFLLGAIGNALREIGFGVCYITADRFFELMAQKRFLEKSFKPDPVVLDLNQRQRAILDDSILLILDDLGIETLTDANYRELFHLLDTRARSGNPMLIGSNIEPANFKDVYDERISSRLVGNFHLIEVMGPDLRVRLAQLRSRGGRREERGR